MVSGYNVTHSQHVSDILVLYKVVPVELWIGFFLWYVTCVLLFKFGMTVVSRRQEVGSTWAVFAEFMSEGTGIGVRVEMSNSSTLP